MSLLQQVYGYVANEESYPDNAVIIEEGGRGNWVYIILEGQAKVKKKTPKGMLAVYTLNPGDIFGEMILLESSKGIRTASVIAEGTVRLGVLDTERLLADYESISQQLKGLIKSLIMRLEDTTSRVAELAVK